SPPRRSRIGDIRMRDIYRGLAVVAALAVVAVGVTLVLPSEPDETGARPVAAPSAAPVSSGPVSSGPVSPSSPLASGSASPEPTVKQAAVAGDEEPVPAS